MISDPGAYFREYGQFHDAYLKRLRWDCDRQLIELAIDDYRAAIDEDDAPDDAEGSLAFAGVASLLGALDDSHLGISELSVERDAASWQARLILKSGATLTWKFESVAEVEKGP